MLASEPLNIPPEHLEPSDENMLCFEMLSLYEVLRHLIKGENTNFILNLMVIVNITYQREPRATERTC
jgi:hypothetical protein